MFAHVFGPSELEIIEQAYKLACARLALNPFRDVAKDCEREKALREVLFSSPSVETMRNRCAKESLQRFRRVG